MSEENESFEGDWLLVPSEGAEVQTNLGNTHELPSIKDAEWVMENFEHYKNVMDDLEELGCPRNFLLFFTPKNSFS